MVVHSLSALDTLGFTQLQFSFTNGMWLDAMESITSFISISWSTIS